MSAGDMPLSIAISRAEKAAAMLFYGEHVEHWGAVLKEAQAVMRRHGIDVEEDA